MVRPVFFAASMAYMLTACSDPPPTVSQYVGQTHGLESDLAVFIMDGYQHKDFDGIWSKVSSHADQGASVSGLPDVCISAAKSLSRLIWTTNFEWPYDHWREEYADYDAKQGNCEKAVGIERSRRSVAPNLPTRKQISDYWATHPRQG